MANLTQEFPNPRYERKFIIPTSSLAQVLATVKHHPALFREVYPPRYVNNIYLDTHGFRDYFDHVNGATNRVKTRIRWYGELSGKIEKPTLERKLRQGIIGGKISYPVPGFSMNGCIPREEMDGALAGSALPETLRTAFRQLLPALVNRYHRHYFLSRDGIFRLTVDTQIGFFGTEHRSGWQAPFSSPGIGVVVELKYEPQHAGRATMITEALPFRLSRCSKYVLGLEAARMV